MVVRIVLMSGNIAAMSGILVIIGITARYRKEKLMKASSPSLLYLILTGALVLYSEVLAAAFPAHKFTCMVCPWLRHTGFALTYGTLLVKVWRISTIMRVFKSRSLQTKDSSLYKTVIVVCVVVGVYLTTWSAVDPVTPARLPYDKTTKICQLVWWEVLITAAEMGFLGWGGVLCYRARKAPDLYNESRSVALALWNEALWAIAYIFARFLIFRHPDVDLLFVLHFIRTQLTVTATVLLLFVPKFVRLFSSVRELHGTITDVYGGARRVHRLSLVVDKHGTIRHIYCVPCGPLAYQEHEDDSDDGSSDEGDNAKENQYTKGEVDALIEMVSRLKTEKECYKSQVKRLHQTLKEHRHKIPNGLSTSITEEMAETKDNPGLDLSGLGQGGGGGGFAECPSVVTTPCEDSVRLGELMVGGATSSSLGLHITGHSRKASTATTYLSMTPDNVSLLTNEEDDAILQSALHNGKYVLRRPSLPNLPFVPCATCAANLKSQNGREHNSLAILKQRIREHYNSTTENETSFDANDEEFPKIVHTFDTNYNQNQQSFHKGLVTTICGHVTQKADDKSKIELHELPTSPQSPKHLVPQLSGPSSHKLCPHAPVKEKPRRSKSLSDKMTFVMYI